MFGRKPAKTSAQQALDELAKGYNHLKRAAGHAAGGAVEWMTPRAGMGKSGAAKNLAKGAFAPLAPLVGQLGQFGQSSEVSPGQIRRMGERWLAQQGWGSKIMREKNGNEEKAMRRPRLSKKMMGLVLAGAAVGTAGAIAARRRKAGSEWSEYEPAPEEMAYGEPPAKGRKMASSLASAAEAVRSKASKAAQAVQERTGHQESPEAPPLRPPTPPEGGAAPASGSTASGSTTYGTLGSG